MKLIVGLGNPGKRYEKTRHNVGFMVLDALHEKLKIECDANDWELSKKFNGYISGCTKKNEKLILLKPATFMNDSGQSVQLLAHYYKIPARDILVVHDDKDIALGEIKQQAERGHAGHNGIKSIVEHIGSNSFTRLRLGVASKNEKKMNDVSKFVLGKFGLFEKKTLEKMIEQTIKHINKWM